MKSDFSRDSSDSITQVTMTCAQYCNSPRREAHKQCFLECIQLINDQSSADQLRIARWILVYEICQEMQSNERTCMSVFKTRDVQRIIVLFCQLFNHYHPKGTMSYISQYALLLANFQSWLVQIQLTAHMLSNIAQLLSKNLTGSATY